MATSLVGVFMLPDTRERKMNSLSSMKKHKDAVLASWMRIEVVPRSGMTEAKQEKNSACQRKGCQKRQANKHTCLLTYSRRSREAYRKLRAFATGYKKPESYSLSPCHTARHGNIDDNLLHKTHLQS